jgi:hypothetical protein
VETAKGQTREEMVTGLAQRIDSFEKYADPHSHLMAALAVGLSRRMGLAQADIAAIREGALLHDVGLFAMSPAYHSSPGPLSFGDRMDLWRHPVIGEQQMAKRDATRYAQLLVRWHHERWNGSGYPDSLAFEDIPIGARILCTVELYSALISDRPYRAKLPVDEVLVKFRASAGVEGDPYVVKALLALLEELRQPTAPPDEATGAVPASAHGGHVEAPVPDEPQPPQPHFFEPFYGPGPGAAEGPEQKMSAPITLEGTSPEAQLGSTIEAAGPLSLQRNEAVPALLPPISSIITKIGAQIPPLEGAATFRGWKASRYNKKSLMGFEASVLRQVEFRSIAIPFSGGTRLDWYLKTWGKQIFSNDPRSWAAMVSKATLEARAPLTEEQISRLLEDIYVPAAWLRNGQLRRWFNEMDSWWMDNLRRNIDAVEDEVVRAQAFALGFQVGDYALSFDDETRELKRPLTTVFWQLAGRAANDLGHPNNRVHNGPAREFILRVHADLLYLDLPASHGEHAGSEARAQWRECWTQGRETADADDLLRLTTIPQSKQAYLATADRLLRAAAHMKKWAIGYQETGLASAREVSDLIKEHRPVTATYSKDLTEVAGGLRNYIIVAEAT